MLSEADAYIDALIKEMQRYRGQEIDTVFIGGGTPTVLNNTQLERLCSSVFSVFRVHSDYEFTVEANPGTVDFGKARLLHSCGVNRMSVGVQSFNASELEVIGRIHGAGEAYNTIEEVSRAGISNISLDIMTALPGQTKALLANTINTALKLPVKHISAYSLIIEDTTPLAADYEKGLISLPGEEQDREMYAMTKQMLEEKGFKQYEISNFALPGYESRHNIKYWECREYIGLGAAAHSYIDGVRSENTADLSEYIAGNYRTDRDVHLSKDDMMFEFVMMGMRMNRGISEAEFKRRFDADFCELYKNQLQKFIGGGFIVRDGEYIRFTDKGRDVSNSVLCGFLPE